MPFKKSDCDIPTVWCGNGAPPKRKRNQDTYYTRTGTRYECMQKGFGAGMYTERNKKLPVSSLQQIKYTGEKYEKKFKAIGIKTTTQLIKEMGKKTSSQIQSILKKIYTKKGGAGLDKRGYNSCLVFLYRHGIGGLPKCQKI